MACIAETLGLSFRIARRFPAVHADRLVAAERSGAVAVELIKRPIAPQALSPLRKSIENALRVLMAVTFHQCCGASRGDAGRLGIRITRELFNRISDETPVLVDLKPVATATWRISMRQAAWARCCTSFAISCISIRSTYWVETLEQRLSRPLEWVGSQGDPPLCRTGLSPVGGLIALRR